MDLLQLSLIIRSISRKSPSLHCVDMKAMNIWLLDCIGMHSLTAGSISFFFCSAFCSFVVNFLLLSHMCKIKLVTCLLLSTWYALFMYSLTRQFYNCNDRWYYTVSQDTIWNQFGQINYTLNFWHIILWSKFFCCDMCHSYDFIKWLSK